MLSSSWTGRGGKYSEVNQGVICTHWRGLTVLCKQICASDRFVQVIESRNVSHNEWNHMAGDCNPPPSSVAPPILPYLTLPTCVRTTIFSHDIRDCRTTIISVPKTKHSCSVVVGWASHISLYCWYKVLDVTLN